MWCMKCNNDLADCVCPDLQERGAADDSISRGQGGSQG